jgi:hypothetical protein
MAVEYQEAFNIAMLGLGATIGWVVKGMSERIQKLEAEDRIMLEKINALAITSASKSDLKQSEDRIMKGIDKLFDKVDNLQTQVSNKQSG